MLFPGIGQFEDTLPKKRFVVQSLSYTTTRVYYLYQSSICSLIERYIMSDLAVVQDLPTIMHPLLGEVRFAIHMATRCYGRDEFPEALQWLDVAQEELRQAISWPQIYSQILSQIQEDRRIINQKMDELAFLMSMIVDL